MTKLPVWRTFKDSFVFVARNPRALALCGVFTWSALVLVDIYDIYMESRGRTSFVMIPGKMAAWMILYWFWYRFMLLGEKPSFLPRRSEPGDEVVAFGAFLGYYLLFYFILGLFPIAFIMIAFGKPGIALVILYGILFSIIYVKVCFVFPAAAIGVRTNPAKSWRQTRGVAMRLYAVLALQFLAIALVALSASILVPYDELGTAERIAVDAVADAVAIIGTAVMLIPVSLAYLRIAEDKPSGPLLASRSFTDGTAQT